MICRRCSRRPRMSYKYRLRENSFIIPTMSAWSGIDWEPSWWQMDIKDYRQTVIQTDGQRNLKSGTPRHIVPGNQIRRLALLWLLIKGSTKEKTKKNKKKCWGPLPPGFRYGQKRSVLKALIRSHLVSDMAPFLLFLFFAVFFYFDHVFCLEFVIWANWDFFTPPASQAPCPSSPTLAPWAAASPQAQPFRSPPSKLWLLYLPPQPPRSCAKVGQAPSFSIHAQMFIGQGSFRDASYGSVAALWNRYFGSCDFRMYVRKRWQNK